jgi:glutamate racemase
MVGVISEKPLGVFDSGVGGLTVLAAIRKALPDESTLYLGDTARVPYGSKSASVVTRYALNNARFLVAKGIKLLVVACNTASAVALQALQSELDVPVLGVIEAGAKWACRKSQQRIIGVIGTEATIVSNAYARALRACDASIEVHQKACPLFVPLAEEGWSDHQVTRQVAFEYLAAWSRESGIDALILGCTHYPLLMPAIRSALGEGIQLVDSALAVALSVELALQEAGIQCTRQSQKAAHDCYVTDVPDRFRKVGERFLGYPLPGAKQVDLPV